MDIYTVIQEVKRKRDPENKLWFQLNPDSERGVPTITLDGNYTGDDIKRIGEIVGEIIGIWREHYGYMAQD